MNALLVIDVQKDFCPGGALPAPDGDKIIPAINELMKKFPLVVASKDWHPEESFHFEKWPKHCIQNKKGAEFHDDLWQGPIAQVFLKGTSTRDEGYSAFEASNADLDEFLKERNVKHVYIVGLITEYCVKETALEAVRRGYDTYVIKDAVAGVKEDRDSEEKAFKELEKAGVKLVSKEEILQIETEPFHVR